MDKYRLRCTSCGMQLMDSFTYNCPMCADTSPLLRTEFNDRQMSPLDIKGIWKFLPWLPCEDAGPFYDGQTVVYKSSGLADELELRNLYLAFNGYWPEKDANLATCTFKELEAPPTLQRATEKGIERMVLPSAGNTARAFINAARFFNIDLFVVVPYENREMLVLPFEVPDNVTVIAVDGGGDYSDAIFFAARMTGDLGMVNEGGARNVARRDGLGTVLLEAVLHMKTIPKHYFQAVGSGAGGIAAWEASQRLVVDGRFGNELAKLHLSQNHPFTPMVDAWNNGSRELTALDDNEQREATSKVHAKVLTNRHPPYTVTGGVYDALVSSSGTMYSITNMEALSAGGMFEKLEGVDIVPASCVAVASLIKAVEEGTVGKNDVILLNITGGGVRRVKEDFDTHRIQPDILCDRETDMGDLKKALEGSVESS